MALTKVIGEGVQGISNASDATAITISSGEVVTLADDLIIKDSGTIGSASKTDAITIASSGLVQLTSTGIGAGSQVFQVIDDGATLFQIRAEDGNVSFPQSGAGVYLGVTSGNAAHLLDHYETGSWTPTLSSTSASFSYSFNGGHYVRVGDMVTCLARITSNANASGTTTNALFIAGLPFTIYNQSDLYSGDSLGHFISFSFASGYTSAALQYQQNSTTVLLNYTGDNKGESTAAASAVSSSTQFRFRLTYRTA